MEGPVRLPSGLLWCEKDVIICLIIDNVASSRGSQMKRKRSANCRMYTE